MILILSDLKLGDLKLSRPSSLPADPLCNWHKNQAQPAETEGCTAKCMHESIKYLYPYIIATSGNRNFLKLFARWGKKKDKITFFKPEG